MRERRVVVTGIGPITTVGIGTDALWAGLRQERSGIGPITRFDPSPFNCHIAGQVEDFAPEEHMERNRARRRLKEAAFILFCRLSPAPSFC